MNRSKVISSRVGAMKAYGVGEAPFIHSLDTRRS